MEDKMKRNDVYFAVIMTFLLISGIGFLGAVNFYKKSPEIKTGSNPILLNGSLDTSSTKKIETERHEFSIDDVVVLTGTMKKETGCIIAHSFLVDPKSGWFSTGKNETDTKYICPQFVQDDYYPYEVVLNRLNQNQ